MVSIHNIFKAFLLSGIWLYRKLISPWMTPRCRFLPTCSEYGMDAIKEYGPFKGAIMTAKRIGRCHPWGGPGDCHQFDPVQTIKSREQK